MRLIDADKIVYLWQIDADGEEHDGVTLESIIKKMPTIEERKTGRWIKENIVLTSYPPQYQWHCSQCGQAVRGFTADVLTDYCPHCGARMEDSE